MATNIKRTPAEKIAHIVQKFIWDERVGGIVLGINVIIALILANSPLTDTYHYFLERKFGFQFDGKTYLENSLYHWINDGLMAVFFFRIGLGLKREVVSGELSNPRRALLPIIATIGGMAVPAGIYLIFSSGQEARNGWGIPMATDIAFALGVLCLLGKRIPLWFKVFLTTLSVVDDLGSVVVIAFFYNSEIFVTNLLIGFFFLFIMYLGNRLGVRSILFYMGIGIFGVWSAFLLSGVHATIAAVLAAFTIPADVAMGDSDYLNSVQKHLGFPKRDNPGYRASALAEERFHRLNEVRKNTNKAISPLQRLEYSMYPLVTFIILPVFALANAGISFLHSDTKPLLSENITLVVAMALLVGKVTGVVGFTWLCVKLKIAPPFNGMTFKHLFGLGLLASIGFTMAFFVTSLAFTTEAYMTQAKIGVFMASIVGGTLGYLFLRWDYPSK